MAVSAAEDEAEDIWLFFVTQSCRRTSTVVTGFWLELQERQQPHRDSIRHASSTAFRTYVPWQEHTGDTLARNTVLAVVPLAFVQVSNKTYTLSPNSWESLRKIHIAERDGEILPSILTTYRARSIQPVNADDIGPDQRTGFDLAIESCQFWGSQVWLTRNFQLP